MNKPLANDLTKLFMDRGYNPIIGTIYEQQEYWLSWYRGDVDGFHKIQKKNIEGTLLSIQKPSLQMAKKVSEDITSLLFNENVILNVSGSETAQDVLDTVLDDNNFYDEMPNFIELTAGPYGTGALIEYQVNGETKLNYLFGDRVVVIDYDNTTVKALAVIQTFQRNGKKYNHIMYHTITNGKYRIQHEMYSNKNAQGLGKPDSLSVLFDEKELKKMRHVERVGDESVAMYYVEYETGKPFFQVFKLGITNNFDVKSPLGISAYANSVGTLENIDEMYYSSKMDSVNSRKRIFVDEEATKLQKTKDVDGNVRYRKYFDQDETQYQPLRGMRDGSKYIDIFAPDYDSMQHTQAIQFELNLLSSKTMLGRNYYSFENGAVGYQNELNVIASNSDTFRNRQKNLNRLRKVLINMMKAIMFLEHKEGRYTGTLELEYDVQFDDDILTDDATRIARLRQDAMDGVISWVEYLKDAYGLTEEEAQEMHAKAKEEEANAQASYLSQFEVNEDDESETD